MRRIKTEESIATHSVTAFELVLGRVLVLTAQLLISADGESMVADGEAMVIVVPGGINQQVQKNPPGREFRKAIPPVSLWICQPSVMESLLSRKGTSVSRTFVNPFVASRRL